MEVVAEECRLQTKVAERLTLDPQDRLALAEFVKLMNHIKWATDVLQQDGVTIHLVIPEISTAYYGRTFEKRCQLKS